MKNKKRYTLNGKPVKPLLFTKLCGGLYAQQIAALKLGEHIYTFTGDKVERVL